MSEVFERRAHPRYAVSFSVGCRRLGPRQGQMDAVRVVDVSLGGMRIEAPSWMDIGNVVEIEGEGIAVRALVVGVSEAPAPAGTEAGGAEGGDASGSGGGASASGAGAPGSAATRHAHLAFSSVVGNGVDLDRLVGPRARAS